MEEKHMSILLEISENLQKGKAKVVKELVATALEEQISAKEILEKGLLAGMDIVGEKFKNGREYAFYELIEAGKIYRLEILNVG